MVPPASSPDPPPSADTWASRAPAFWAQPSGVPPVGSVFCMACRMGSPPVPTLGTPPGGPLSAMVDSGMIVCSLAVI